MEDNEQALPSDAVVLMPAPYEVRIGDEVYQFGKFKLAKSIRVMELLSELLAQENVNSFLQALLSGRVDLIAALSEHLPDLIKSARPALYRLLALVVTKDKRLAELDEDEESLDAELARVAARLRAECEMAQAIEILTIAVDGIGLDEIRKNLSTLLTKVAQNRTGSAS